jgi:hypothetical protein
MLDVHPPHEAAHTWKDFFIHIATIVVGLLIAVGLEQMVEALHHHEQVQHARESLSAEREKNRKLFALETRNLEFYTPRFNANLAVFRYLREHPGAPSATWPGSVVWGNNEVPFVTAAWSTVQRDAVIEHLTQEEVEQFDDLYQRLNNIRAAELQERASVERTGHLYAATDELQHASSEDLNQLIDATNDVLIAHARIGTEMNRLNKRFPEFAPTPADAPLAQILGIKPNRVPDPIMQQIMREFYAISAPSEASTDH